MPKTPQRPIRWLHLSDLHLGCPGRALWWKTKSEFAESLKTWIKQVGGPPEVVLSEALSIRRSSHSA